jgi:hypothetical protein
MPSGSRWFRLASLAALAAACASRQLARSPSMPDAELPPFRFEQRLAVYRAADDAAWALWHASARSTREREVRRDGRTMRLVVECRDGDGQPEEWVMLPPGQEDGPDFGFAFDLDRDGRIDYVVFNGGPLLDREFRSLSWMNYHWIDTNADGRVDVVVYNDVDRDRDGFLESGWTAWVYDRDLDGVLDAAEYLGPRGEAVPIAATDDGCLVVQRVLGEQRHCASDRRTLAALDEIVAEVQLSMR